MKTEIVITGNFQREAKKYLKKYKSLKSELENLYDQLLKNPQLGTPISNNSFKIRISVKSKNKGKSAGMRIITHLEIDLVLDEVSNHLYLLSIYDKSEIDSISDKEINRILKELKRN
jgi:mRNA-degrading endonuclease RelE of RelBE toxin-antitoxin system